MKKFLSLLLVLVMCVSLASCGSGETSGSTSANDTEDVKTKVKNSVYSYILGRISVQYDTVGSPNVTYYISEVSENNFEVSGKVTVKDKYGDSYSGKYDATVKYNASTEKCTVNLELGSLYKVK